MLELLTKQLKAGQPLSAGQVTAAVRALTEASLPAGAKAEFLEALAEKGETIEEIAAFANELRGLSLPVPLDAETRRREIMDVVGTGGDQLHTFNISTTSGLLLAAAGVTVAKHGNRAITSQAGSADTLEALGIPIDLAPDQAAAALRERRFAFFFAPHYHPAFKHIAPARRLCAERGRRTIFNFLGPLLNPARPSAILVGVPRPDLCEPLARVLQSLGVRRGMVVCGATEDGRACMDELSLLGDNTIAEFYQERALAVSKLSPAPYRAQPVALADLVGGDRAQNADTTRRILSGQERGPKREAVLFNAGAALFVAGQAKSIADGWELAARIIETGQAEAKLQELSRPNPRPD